ncbi:MAG: methyltransferase domain-containing protein [Nannocystaceae bacterium]|nr:methyltransferase domain-containing protein [Nannocystaceae bacterium]
MAWYDLFASFYDLMLDGVYRRHRAQAATALQLVPGMTVVDVGCGTGASFDALVAAVGPTGRVIGIDASAGMLRKAARRAQRNGWDNIELVEIKVDDPEATKQTLRTLGEVDRVLCFLSLSVIEGWAAVLTEWFRRMTPRGRLVIADVHNAKPGLYGRYVQVVSQATLTRKSWEPLEAMASDFELAWQPSSWMLGGQLFIAAGSR